MGKVVTKGFIKKTSYESIYEWVNSKAGTCYYCYQDKTPAIVLIGEEKGICQECVDNFKIGHFGADRHVISQLCNAENLKQALAWIKKYGGKLEYTGTEDIGCGETEWCHFYNGVNKDGTRNPVQITDDGNIHIVY